MVKPANDNMSDYDRDFFRIVNSGQFYMAFYEMEKQNDT